MDNKEKALYGLKKYYGYEKFRSGQLKIILSILDKRDVFCIMPTGAGKSICYQIAALIMNGITLVISPLISLMKDQVDGLKDNGIKATYINSTQSMEEISVILKDASLGEYKLIYITPERLESRIFLGIVKSLEISQVAVDEAHCVSEWGHDFRMSYRYIGPFIESLDNRPVVSAFTATATEEVKDDSMNLLSLKKPYVFIGDINRENLAINVYKEEDKDEGIKGIIQNHPEESGIIYCLTRKEVEHLHGYLKELGYSVTMYHGGLSDEEKKKNQEDFLYDRLNTMIATNAFGMGIDKSNVRYVIHCTIPKSLESYYQEIGRGGRDGAPCDCYLYYNRDDIRRVEFIINNSSDIKISEIALRKLEALIEFCEETKCYRTNLLRYFDKEWTRDYCANCSNCLQNEELRDYMREAQMVISTVYRTKEAYGISVIIDILRGYQGPKIIKDKLESLTTFGIMKEYTTTFIRALIKEMIRQEFVVLKEGTYSMLKITQKAVEILRGERKVLLLIKEEETALNPELYNILKIWRKQRANRDSIKPYIIFSDATLIEIVNKLPKSMEDLFEIRGVGEKKIERYGDEVLKIINGD
ncbi:DNA helicase RecQ [Clostridium vincentii]|uniref:DNA helicase RecQ n=1 Tax=Clostridium vincentii TaxID=52704 RepID=A0A2T0BLA0_9CLOT|nr:DNA helicase RecQ [Clostridium vincentii]PRR84613.1 ATP-dependent DNA helicase RecQ [Clostridium vincentii]